jgi:ATP-dependent DNA helicase PIF1
VLSSYSPENYSAWRNVDILIIDEISMLNKSTFELIEELARATRNSSKPFGGIQLILSGDFHQLPPIEGDYAFESKQWSVCIQLNILLKGNMRQQKDICFYNILQKLREGNVDSEVEECLLERFRLTKNLKLPECCLRLFFRRKQVEKFNQECLENMEGECVLFNAKTQVFVKECVNENQFQLNPYINLKIKATVILTKNVSVEDGLTNGTVGTIESLDLNSINLNIEGKIVCIKEFKEFIKSENNRVLAWRSGLPVSLAFSMTVHKSQGMTLKRVLVSLFSKPFSTGLLYVAISRVSSMEDLFIEAAGEEIVKEILKEVKACEKVKQFYNNLNVKQCLKRKL